MPPVSFFSLLGNCQIEDSIRTEISVLLSIKKRYKESDISKVSEGLMAFAKEKAEFYNKAVSAYRPEDQREDFYPELDKLAFDMICKIC